MLRSCLLKFSLKMSFEVKHFTAVIMKGTYVAADLENEIRFGYYNRRAFLCHYIIKRFLILLS